MTLHVADIGATAGPPLWGETRLLRGMLPPGATSAVRAALVPGGLHHRRVHLAVDDRPAPPVRLWVPAVMVFGAFPGGAGSGSWAAIRSRGGPTWRCDCPAPARNAYGDEALLRWPRRAFWAMVVAGLTELHPPLETVRPRPLHMVPGHRHIPKSLLGTDIEAVSNAYPPTICFLMGGVWRIGAVMLLRPYVTRWLQHRRP